MSTTRTDATAADAATTSAAVRPAALPGVLRSAASRVRYELVGYFRQGDTVFFTFLFPVMILVIFSSIFSGEVSPAGVTGRESDGTTTVSMATYYLPGILAAGLLLSGLQNLATDIATEKYNGRLKRLGGTPMSPTTYFLGKLGQVLVTGIGQAALILLVAVVGFGVELPRDAGSWLTFAWVFLLGLVACALLGVALSSVPRSGRSASAVVIPIVLVLQFISGVYVLNYQLPETIQNIANVFPLAWLARGMRSAFLPQEFAALEQGGTWAHGQTVVVLLVWLVVGTVLSRLTFRWIRRDA